MGPLEFESLSLLPDTAQFDLTLEMAEVTTGGIIAAMHYNTDLFDANTAKQFADLYTTIVRGVCAAVDSRIDSLPMLPSDMRAQMLVDWNKTAYVCLFCLCVYLY